MNKFEYSHVELGLLHFQENNYMFLRTISVRNGVHFKQYLSLYTQFLCMGPKLITHG